MPWTSPGSDIWQYLINISKVHVLSVRHISESGRIQIPPFKSTFHRGLKLISPPILSTQEDPEGDNQTHFDKMRNDHRPDSQLITGGLVGQVKERADDLGEAVSKIPYRLQGKELG